MPGDREYHLRMAGRLRSVADIMTTPALKRDLLEQAEEHERLAKPAKSNLIGERAATEGWVCPPT